MYLCDKHLLEKWPELDLVCDNSDCATECRDNVQPSSIDMCLSNVFWEPTKRKPIDLRKSALLELAPRRYWKKRVLRKNEHITLKPGKLLLGRLAAKLTIPRDCAGKIEGRSSFARMGLGVHCTGDYINPGYRGHMPLELFNFSPNPIKVFPFLPICQLKLVRLSGKPNRVYGDVVLASKYMDDDGGPSFWWRDKRIGMVQKIFSEKSVALFVQEQLLKKLGVQEPEIIERFEDFVQRRPDIGEENADVLLEEFTESEERLKRRDSIVKGFAKVLFPICVAASIGSLFVTSYTPTHYLVWGCTVFSSWPFIWVLQETPKQYLGKQELSVMERPHEN